jgi:ABC-2 type transport system ATP-binding protein
MFQRVEALSKGFRRRLGLALAVLHDPDVLILDEPTDGLDPNQKYQVRAFIRALGHRKAILISTHLLEEVDALADRVVVMDRGRIRFEGGPDQLRALSPDHDALTLTVRSQDAGASAEALRRMPGGGAVLIGADNCGQTRILARRGEGAAASPSVVAKALAGAGVSLVELRTERGDLSEVFRQLTRGSLSGEA